MVAALICNGAHCGQVALVQRCLRGCLLRRVSCHVCKPVRICRAVCPCQPEGEAYGGVRLPNTGTELGNTQWVDLGLLDEGQDALLQACEEEEQPQFSISCQLRLRWHGMPETGGAKYGAIC